MNKKNRFIVNPFLFAVALVTWLVLTAAAIAGAVYESWALAAMYFVFGLIFLAVAIGNSILVSVEEEGICRYFLWKKISCMSWDEIKEVGVCGTRPFHGKNSDKVGTLYIYISPEKMRDNERFDMILNWPPRDKIYMLHSEKRLLAVQYIWSGVITTYNAGKFHIG